MALKREAAHTQNVLINYLLGFEDIAVNEANMSPDKSAMQGQQCDGDLVKSFR